MSIEFAIFHESTDGLCWRCEESYDIHLVGAFDDDAWTCPNCLDLDQPGMGEVIRGLDQVWNGVSLDMAARPTPNADYGTVTAALRNLADIIDGIADNSIKLQICVQLVDGFLPGEKGDPVGVMVERRIIKPTAKQTVKETRA